MLTAELTYGVGVAFGRPSLPAVRPRVGHPAKGGCANTSVRVAAVGGTRPLSRRTFVATLTSRARAR